MHWRVFEEKGRSLQAVVELSESVTPSESKGRRKRWVERMAGLRLVGIDGEKLRLLRDDARPTESWITVSRKTFSLLRESNELKAIASIIGPTALTQQQQ